ncbi:MAG: hypothetical protein WD060_07670 [Pirellulales bacterium]
MRLPTPSQSLGGTLLALIACVPVMAVMAVMAGCGRVRPTPETADRSIALRSFALQLTEVRDGTSRRIVAESPLTEEEWEALRSLAGLRELVLHSGVADDAKAEILATLPALERLVLRESPLSDAGFRAIARCGTLRNLNVPKASCTAEGVRALRELPELRSLRLGGANLAGAAACAAIATLPALESLHLIDVQIGDAGLAILAEMPRLTNLYLDGAAVSDEAWGGYCESRPDVHIHVDQAHHDRDPNRAHDTATPSLRGSEP